MKINGKNYELNIKNSFVILIFIFLSSCQYFRQDAKKTPIAQVYDSYLYLEDVNPKIFANKSSQDSTMAIRDYIEHWAYKTLLIKQAEKNVDTAGINKMVRQYKQDLLIDTYTDLLSEKYLDTVVSQAALKQSFEKNKHYYIAAENMVSTYFLVVDKDNKASKRYKKWFFSDKNEFRDSLIKNSLYFNKINLHNENWQTISKFKQTFPVFKRINARQILKKSKKFVLTDSLSLYLVFVNDIVKENAPLPYNFIKEDLRQLILNQRKQKEVLKLQNEIKTAAIKNRKFKIFKINKNEG